MNKRIDDQLIKLAFDDQLDSVPAEFEGKPEAAARLSEYKMMRSALGEMRNIPEHQLSTERLRAALLQQDLKRRFAFPWATFCYGATACALFVGAFFAGRYIRQPHVETTVSMASRPKQNLFVPPASFVKTEKSLAMAAQKPVANHVHLAIVAKADPAMVINHNYVVEYVANNSPQKLISTELARPAVASEGSVIPHSIDEATAKNSAVKDANASPTPASRALNGPAISKGKQTGPETIVVLQSDTDSTSGLDTATEEKANHQLLIGG